MFHVFWQSIQQHFENFICIYLNAFLVHTSIENFVNWMKWRNDSWSFNNRMMTNGNVFRLLFAIDKKRSHELKPESGDFDDFSFGFCDDGYYYCLFVCKFYLFLWLNEYYMWAHGSNEGNQIKNFFKAIKILYFNLEFSMNESNKIIIRKMNIGLCVSCYSNEKLIAAAFRLIGVHLFTLLGQCINNNNSWRIFQNNIFHDISKFAAYRNHNIHKTFENSVFSDAVYWQDSQSVEDILVWLMLWFDSHKFCFSDNAITFNQQK